MDQNNITLEEQVNKLGITLQETIKNLHKMQLDLAYFMFCAGVDCALNQDRVSLDLEIKTALKNWAESWEEKTNGSGENQ